MFQVWWFLTSLFVSLVFYSSLPFLHLHLQDMRNMLCCLPPSRNTAQFILYEGMRKAFLVLLYLKRLNYLRWISSICHLINSRASSSILAFFSSVLLWKCNQNKTLGTVWGIYFPLLSFLCFWKQLCLVQGRLSWSLPP